MTRERLKEIFAEMFVSIDAIIRSELFQRRLFEWHYRAEALAMTWLRLERLRELGRIRSEEEARSLCRTCARFAARDVARQSSRGFVLGVLVRVLDVLGSDEPEIDEVDELPADIPIPDGMDLENWLRRVLASYPNQWHVELWWEVNMRGSSQAEAGRKHPDPRTGEVPSQPTVHRHVTGVSIWLKERLAPTTAEVAPTGDEGDEVQ